MAEIRINATGELKLYDSDDSNYVSFKSAGTVSSNVAWVLPSADGSSGQMLSTDGSGTLSWATASSADPSSADGDSLGTASAEWSDLYLADGGIVYFGNDQDIRLTHNADKGLIIKHSATADDKPVILTLQTGETDMAANDVIGKIEFQAPDEGTGTDAVLVSAAIQAVAEGDHSSSSNATRLEFMTGASEAAASKMTLSSGGVLDVDGGITIDNITIDGTEIDLSSGDLTLDVAGDIYLNADGGDIIFQDGSATTGKISYSGGNMDISSDGSDNDIVFKGNDGGSAITALTLDMSAGGDLTLGANANIVFPATNVVSTNANTLDDYEEGSFTPTVTASSVAYDNRTGRYTKVGNKVFVECLVQWNSGSFSNDSAALTITGLPFAPVSTIHYHGAYGVAYISSLDTNNVDGVTVNRGIASSANDSSAVEIIVMSDDAGGSKVKNLNNGSAVFSFVITYRTAA